MSSPTKKAKVIVEMAEDQVDKENLPWWLQLPPELEGASNEQLADRYYELAEQKLAGETRAGRHPSGMDNPKNIDPDPLVRAVLIAGLRVIVREMGAVHYELNNRPGGLAALLPDGPWKNAPKP